MPPPPNILFVFTDQQSASAMSCAGDGHLQTPAMDSLARNGTRFERTYCTFPLCTPSRVSLMTGLMPHQIGCTGNGVALSDGVRANSLGRLFEAAGYECVYSGKWHIPRYELAEGFGFQKICGFGDDKVAEACVEFLRQKRQRPFLLVASFDNPHNICEWARNDPLPWGAVEESSDDVLPELPADFAVPADAPEALIAERAGNPRVHPTLDKEPPWWRRYRYAYRRLVERVDAQIGRILAALEESGLRENTLVVFSSDHGDGDAHHQWNQKSALYEPCVRVPLILSLPERIRAGKVDSTHLVSNGLDLLPTFCDYASIAPPEGLEGRSLRGLLERGGDPGWRQELAVETCFTPPAYRGTFGRMLRTERYKYVAYSWGEHREQLFDLQTDPGETTNLAANPQHQVALDEHRLRLAAWRQRSGDEASFMNL